MRHEQLAVRGAEQHDCAACARLQRNLPGQTALADSGIPCQPQEPSSIATLDPGPDVAQLSELVPAPYQGGLDPASEPRRRLESATGGPTGRVGDLPAWCFGLARLGWFVRLQLEDEVSGLG